MLGDPAVGDPPEVHVPNGERLARRVTAHQRTRVAPPHRHPLKDLVALGELVLDLEAKLAERVLEAQHGLPDALGAGRPLRVGRLVIDEVGMDEPIRELEVALRVDLVERATNQPLVVLRHHHRPYQVFALT
jgi:hypothetical protein